MNTALRKIGNLLNPFYHMDQVHQHMERREYQSAFVHGLAYGVEFSIYSAPVVFFFDPLAVVTNLGLTTAAGGGIGGGITAFEILDEKSWQDIV